MTGETLAWHRVASHLGRTVNELRETISYSDLADWLAYLDWHDFHHRTKLDYYFAQLTATLVRVNTAKKGLSKVKDENYLLNFTQQRGADVEEKMKKSKAAWGRALKVNLN